MGEQRGRTVNRADVARPASGLHADRRTHASHATAARRRRTSPHDGRLLPVVIAYPLILAHAGEGASWQALVVAISLGLVAVVGLVLAGRLFMSEPGDLVVPLAAVMIVASLAPLAAAVLSDWVGWALPVGVMALLSLVVAAFTPLRLSLAEPATYGAIALAIIGAFVLQAPITRAWHPPVELLPLAGDTRPPDMVR